MNEARMRAILEAYGAEPARWPADERAAASAWLSTHEAAVADVLSAARAVDAALALDARAQGAGEDLVARVLAQRPGANVTPFPSRRLGGWRAVAALAACAAVGVVVGFGSVGGDDFADADAVLGEAFGFGPETGG